MAIAIPRFLVTNLIQATATILSASSFNASLPYTYLRDQLRSKVWRSRVGWTIVAGVNDKIDFNRGGVKVATIAAGYYATGAALAAAIVAALEAADSVPVWACTYDSGTHKFTISSDLSFTLLFGTGVTIATSVHPDIGFATADTSSATSHTGGTAVYQSRHFIGADLGSAMATIASVIINHNLGAGGTVNLRRSSTSVLDAVANQAGSQQLLAGDASIRIAFYASVSRRYWALVIDNTTSTDGFTEVGIWYLGDYSSPTFCHSVNFVRRRTPLSNVQTGDFGAHYVDVKPVRREWELEWLEVPESDRALLEAADAAAPMGTNFFLAFDPTVTPTDTVYGFFASGQEQHFVAGSYWTIPVYFLEALG